MNIISNLYQRLFDKPSSSNVEKVPLGFAEGRAFADPDIEDVDRFERHTEVAAKVNQFLDQSEKLRAMVRPLDQGEKDLNPRRNVIVVDDLPYQDGSVDAVITYDWGEVLEARVSGADSLSIYDSKDDDMLERTVRATENGTDWSFKIQNRMRGFNVYVEA